jgi:hypothetical protein
LRTIRYRKRRKMKKDIERAFSTTTTERAFSAINLVKIRLRNKMEGGLLKDILLLIYIEKEIAVGFSTDEIIDKFNTENHRVPLD